MSKIFFNILYSRIKEFNINLKIGLIKPYV